MSETLKALVAIREEYLACNAGGNTAYGNIFAAVLHSLRVGAPGLSEMTREVLAHNATKKALALSAAVSPTPANALHDDKPSPDHAALVGALKALEDACDRVAASRPQEAYDAMIAGGQEDDLLALDEARREARRLAAALHPSAEGGADKT